MGEGTYRMLVDNQAEILNKTGAKIEVVRIGVRDSQKKRSLPASHFTTDLQSIVSDENVDVVLELIGGGKPR